MIFKAICDWGFMISETLENDFILIRIHFTNPKSQSLLNLLRSQKVYLSKQSVGDSHFLR